jgi:uncharacterized protein
MITEAKIRRHPEREATEHAPEILAAGHVAHVGFIENGRPFVIPFTYHYDSEFPHSIFLHGSPGSRAMRTFTQGAAVCVTVTLLDGLVYSRDAKYHSMNYRSVVCFGNARRATEELKHRMFAHMISRYFPGRTEGRDYEAATNAQLASTELVEIQINEWSAKIRTGGPKGPRDADAEASGTCGIADMT